MNCNLSTNNFPNVGNPIMNLLNQAIQNNPALRDNAQAQNYIHVLQSGDSQKGQQLAENICKTMGVTPQQAVQQAMSFFQSR